MPEAKPEEHPLAACKQTVHVIGNLLQACLGYMELGQWDKAKKAAQDASQAIHDLRVKLK